MQPQLQQSDQAQYATGSDLLRQLLQKEFKPRGGSTFEQLPDPSPARTRRVVIQRCCVCHIVGCFAAAQELLVFDVPEQTSDYDVRSDYGLGRLQPTSIIPPATPAKPANPYISF